MTNNQFVRMPAISTTEAKYEAIVNHHFINHAVPSRPGQVGKSIVTMARDPDGRDTVACTHDLDTLARMISALTPVQVYDTARGEVSSRGLVNMARVVRITEHEKFSHLAFVDGEHINVAGKLI